MSWLLKMIPVSFKDTVKRKITIYSNLGMKYHCPFCGYRFSRLETIGVDVEVLKKLKVIGAGKREAGCWNCGSTDRERLLYIYLSRYSDVLKKSRNILHIAPEPKIRDFINKINVVKYICGDKFTDGYQYPPEVQNIDITNFHFADNSFELIICNHVLEHIIDDAAAMKELFRVLKPGGQAILQVPLSKDLPETIEDFSVSNPKERERLFGQFDHVRIYGKDYFIRLAHAGFIVKKINLSKENPDLLKYGINAEEEIIVVEKPEDCT